MASKVSQVAIKIKKENQGLPKGKDVKKLVKPLQNRNSQGNDLPKNRLSGSKRSSSGAGDEDMKKMKRTSGAGDEDMKKMKRTSGAGDEDMKKMKRTSGAGDEDMKKIKRTSGGLKMNENIDSSNLANTENTQPLQIESVIAKPQDQLSMRERLELWKQEKKQKKEEELKTKKKAPFVPTAGLKPKKEPTKPATVSDRRATFAVTKPAHEGSKAKNIKPDLSKKQAKVTVKKPVLVVGAKKTVQSKIHPNSRPINELRRHSVANRRRLSAGMSKRPVGILKRKSCAPAINSTPFTAVTDGGNKQGESTHVKFLSPKVTPGHHQTFRKTPSKCATADSMRHKLNCWLEAKGRTPSKFRHLMCFDATMSERKRQDSQTARSLTIAQLSKQQEKMAKEESSTGSVCKNLASAFEAARDEQVDVEKCSKVIKEHLDSLLKECHHLIESGCPTDTLLSWLGNIYSNIPLARYYTPWYRCKVEAVLREGRYTEVIEVISQAIRNSAQPASELADLNTSVMKQIMDKASVPLVIDTAYPQMQDIETHSEDGVSPVLQDLQGAGEGRTVSEVEPKPDAPFPIQYFVSNVTPFKKRKRAHSLSTPQHTQTVVTPVRRSTRRSVTGNVTDSEKVIRSISELSETEKNSALFRPNHALDNVLEKYE